MIRNDRARRLTSIRAGVLALALTLCACDPIYIARLDARRTSTTHGAPADSLVAGVARQSGFSRSSDSGAMRFEHSWGSPDWVDHPSSMWVVIEKPADSLWQISISEWLRTRQTPFGARLQRTIDSTLTEAGYLVTMPE